MECHRQEEGEQTPKLNRCCRLDQGHDETLTADICLSVQPKKKKKPKPQPEASAEPAPPEATPPEDGKDEMNGFHANGSVMDGESLDSLSEQLDSASLDAAELDSEPASSETTGNQCSDKRGLFESLSIYNIWMQQCPSAICRAHRLLSSAARLNRRTAHWRWIIVPQSSLTV